MKRRLWRGLLHFCGRCSRPELADLAFVGLLQQYQLGAYSTDQLCILSPPCHIAVGGAGPHYLYFLTPFIIDTIFTVIAFIKCREIAQAGYATNLVKVFLRDGFIYFAVVAAANLVEAIFFIQPIVGLKGLNAPPALALSSIMCCRLVLSLRSMSDANRRDYNISLPPGISGGRSIDRASNGVYRLNLPMTHETAIAIDVDDQPVVTQNRRSRPYSESATLPILPSARSRRVSIISPCERTGGTGPGNGASRSCEDLKETDMEKEKVGCKAGLYRHAKSPRLLSMQSRRSDTRR